MLLSYEISRLCARYFLIHKNNIYMSKKALKMAKKARKYAKEAYNKSKILAVAISIFCSLMFPHQSMATASSIGTSDDLFGQLEEPSPNQMLKIQEYSVLGTNNENIEILVIGSDSFPQILEKQPRIYRVSVSAYTSEVAQTDSSPCITANGFNVCKHNEEDVIATNMFPFGTKVKIPSIDPNRIYTVEDRMNTRYQNHIDIWMKDKDDAIKFGRKTLEIQVF
jgi:3D (Asp-Asp-Asp) domain-containing protein